MPGMGAPAGAGNSSIVEQFHAALLRQGALILLIAVLLFVAWNSLRSLQYRRAAADGGPLRARRPVLGPEPVARRLLRIGFGLLWIFDGLLQLQPGMPLGLSSAVLQPAASSSPGWVQGVVVVAVRTWSRHPTEAAASAVWIQLGIGVLLLVAPRGRWSRSAGVISAGWGLVVWVFGEAFGGLFAPGLTVLFGAPGAALLYVVAGGLVALPDRAWATRTLGRAVTASIGAFLLAMAVLQAWPGRGFWQGTVHGSSGTLAGMVRQMAAIPQPSALASSIRWFGSFAGSNGASVNLVVVVVLAAVGLAFVSGRLVEPALVTLVMFGVADWLLVEDLGVWGGTGTDPNSMVPLLLLAVGGYLATVRIPVTAGVVTEVPVAAPPVAGGPYIAEPDVRTRRWWDRVDAGYAGRLAAAAGALFVVLVGTAPMVSAATDTRADPALAESINGAPAVTDGPAPAFQLVDQSGRPVSLADLRGYTVALTFLDPVCTTDCPVIAQEFRVTSQMLGPAAARVRFVAIATNPDYYSVGVLDAFDRQEGLDAQSNWLFLTGPMPKLQSVWDEYGVGAEVAPAGGMVAHSDVTYVIDASGSTRRVIDSDPGAGDADHASFSSLLASELTQVMHP
ncbi:MAG: SCO family protein [Acidimicrobiales bacterium]